MLPVVEIQFKFTTFIEKIRENYPGRVFEFAPWNWKWKPR